MPIPGSVVHQQLMTAYTAVESRLNQHRQSAGAGEQERESLEMKREQALAKLAEHYLPELTQEVVQSTWAEVRYDLSRILKRKADQQTKLQKSLDSLTHQRQHQEDQLLDVNDQLDQAIRKQETVAAEVEQALHQDEAFADLSDKAAQAEAAIERAEANLKEIEQDATRKLPAYDESTLFRYLHDQGYGTNAYKKRGFTRRMDRWVSQMIDYPKARRSYDFLKQTPESMRTIIAQDRDALDLVMKKLEAIRDRVASQLQLPQCVESVETIRSQRRDVLSELDAIRRQFDTAGKDLSMLEDTRGPFYCEAVSLLRDMLERFGTSDLDRRARTTIQLTDDQIVARLSGFELEKDSLDQESRQHHRMTTQLQKILDAAGRVIQSFRASGFDSGRSQFSGSVDVAGELARAQHESDVDRLWDQLRRDHQLGPSTMDQITKVATHPMTQVLINAMAHAAGGALRHQARRAGRRRRRGPYINMQWGDSSDSFW
ncbi:MAG: hypothetical protein AAGA03_03840 [Planctomycetota bacterium]